jgi:hypothetical protein
MSSIQRRNANLALSDMVTCVAYDPPHERVFLSTIRLEVDLLSRPRVPSTAAGAASASATSASAPTFSAVQLADAVQKQFLKHFFTVGQVILLAVNEINLTFTVKTV